MFALEQQSDDLLTYKDGLKLSGIFYPDKDPKNLDGTYQRVVYSQIIQTFYNNYRDPTKIWGLENIDFDKSKTKRFLADRFKMFEIPQMVFGEKIIENTVIMFDTTTDNDYIISDDGNCNLFAGTNIFARQQEVGEYKNEFLTGSFGYCSFYDSVNPPDQPIMFVLYDSCNISVNVTWSANQWPVSHYIVEKSVNGGAYTQSFDGLAYSYTDTNLLVSGTYSYRMYLYSPYGTSSYTSTASIYSTPIFWDNDSYNWDQAICKPIYWDF